MTKNKTILLKTPTTDLSLSKMKKIASLTLLYCVTKKGTHKYKPLPKVSVVNNPNAKYYGVYKCSTNTIVINRSVCTNIKLFIQTLLHEYTHYLQNMSTYTQIYKKVGYKNHPFEMEARESEKLYSEVFKQIKHLI